MIEHIVWFKWQPEASPEAIAAAMSALRGMKDQIEPILDVTCGEDFSGRSRGFQHGLVVRLRDRASLLVYQDHPVHQAIVQSQIKPILADIMALDYEI
ncbi:MAG: Dabb family protein [Spirulinaceae cyanobacterium RM2_2_10]|nr:Dabb family protein [Spirulinaceae cyanobacterium SM2_1_0]NJO20474.1 Dabb family protein [Spirulinaceae cyanobacterium RM2_2_10]